LINKSTIDRIFETARIEEVVGDFVQLKKRGINLIGNCPFHNEKTPSFTVNSIKGIFKCFGCGKGGNAVNFVMEHEHCTYPDALRFLARKYSIEIEEEVQSNESIEEQNEKESLFIISAFAQKYYSRILNEHPEGIAVGLSYFKERGFAPETIEKFQLGFSLNDWSGFTEAALKEGYKLDYLEKTGLTIVKEGKSFDRFKGRILFPVHNLSGRVIAFGGRILKTDPKSAKYINSPETDIYHKSNVLYGLFQARKAISTNDNCFLVEGYTDVISLHQAGIEDVVSSSGTSLTIEQIRLIGRYTKNVTVLYDGDAAGIKASLRGIDLILEEGLNVKVLLLPDGEDPDSYSKKVGKVAMVDFIKKNSKDFIVFKANLLLQDVANDPIKKAALIREIVETIAKVPDAIVRATYTRQCSVIMEIAEEVLSQELNKIRKKNILKQETSREAPIEELPELIPLEPALEEGSSEFQERDIIRVLILFGDTALKALDETDPRAPVEYTYPVSRLVIAELQDELAFDNALYAGIFKEYCELIEKGTEVNSQYFINHTNAAVQKLATDLLSTRDELSTNWVDMHNIVTPREEDIVEKYARGAINSLKLKKVQKLIEQYSLKMKTCENETDAMALMTTIKKLSELKIMLGKEKGSIILR
jgi:DNA primase